MQNVDRPWHPKTVNLNTFCPNVTFKNRSMTSKNGSTGRLFVTPPLSEIGKKLGKMLKYTPHFQTAFGTAVYTMYIRLSHILVTFSKNKQFRGRSVGFVN